MLSWVELPLESRYMSCVALAGAVSRKSMKDLRSVGHADEHESTASEVSGGGYVTARAKPTATAASIALPPDFSTATPTSAARGSCATTMPLRA